MTNAIHFDKLEETDLGAHMSSDAPEMLVSGWLSTIDRA